jgi:ankyrin repeat protein
VGLPCTERQHLLAQAAKFLNCVEVIATGLEEIREANPKPFEEIVTSPDYEDEEQPDLDMDQSFDEVKADYIAELLSSKNEIYDPQIEIPNVLLKFAHSYQRRLLKLALSRTDIDVTHLNDTLFALHFLSDTEANTMLRSASPQIKNSILKDALKNGLVEMIVLAIENGADINITYKNLDLLSAALLGECEPLIEALLEKDLSKINPAWKADSSTPLHIVFEAGQLGLAKKILENLRQHLNADELMNLFQIHNENAETVIDIVINDLGLDALKMIEEFLGENAFYNILIEGKSPLHVVVERNDIERLKFILSKTHNDLLHLVNEQDDMIAHVIAFNGYQESLDCLAEFIGKGKDWDDLMLDKDPLNQTPLHLAVSQGHGRLVQTILEFTSSATLQNIIVANNLSAQSCVQLALMNDRLDIASVLLKSLAANPGVSVSAHARAFDFAIQHRKPAMMLAIMQSDQANTLSAEKIDRALCLAMELEEPGLATAVIKKQASLGVTWHQSTVLHVALRRNWPNVLSALLERPDDLKTIMSMKNEHNRLALEVVHPDVPLALRQDLEALVKRPQSSPPPSQTKKKKIQ